MHRNDAELYATMHELSIAQSILDIVKNHVPSSDLKEVRSVRVKVGKMSGVVPESLDFSFSALITDTDLGSASLNMELVPFRVRCSSCQSVSETEFGIVLCPKCGSNRTKVISGTELQVLDIELADHGQEGV